VRVQRDIALTPGLNNLAGLSQNHAKALSGGVSFGYNKDNSDAGQNINGWNASGVTPATPATQFPVNHNLGRIPKGFLILSTDQPAHIYKASTPWTKTQIYLASDTASVNYQIFIL